MLPYDRPARAPMFTALVAAWALCACAGEQVIVTPPGETALAPEHANEPLATRKALEAESDPDGNYTSADGLVTGTYDRASGVFSLSKTAPSPLVLILQAGAWQLDPTGIVRGANYNETIVFSDASERSYDVALVYGPLSTTLEWISELDGNTVREQIAELYMDGSWTLDYTDRDPDTAVEIDAEGSFVVLTDESWTGTYLATWDDGSTLTEDLSGPSYRAGNPTHVRYDWRDAATVTPDIDESGNLTLEPDGRIWGTRTRYDAAGAATCFTVEIENGSYLELPAECA